MLAYSVTTHGAESLPRPAPEPVVPDPGDVVGSWEKAGMVEVGNLGFEQYGRLFVTWSDYDGPARAVDNPIPVVDESGAVVAYSDNFVGLIAASKWNDPATRPAILEKMLSARSADKLAASASPAGR
mgnify:CR=1 FL=1